MKDLELRLILASLSMVVTALPATAQIVAIPEDLNIGDRYRLIFVTDTTRDATSDDIEDYNTFVTNDAEAVSELLDLGTTWYALANTPSIDARDNAGIDAIPEGANGVPIYLVNGVRVADDYDHLWGGNPDPLFVPVSISPSGISVGVTYVWTGGVFNGTGFNNGELGAAGGVSERGSTNDTSAGWMGANTTSQANSYPVYGISDVLTVPNPVVPTDLSIGEPYRLVFVTEGTRDGESDDISIYNSFVASEANAVEALDVLNTSWKAIASTPAVDARDNLNANVALLGSSGVPIYRVDQVRVADDYDQLWSGNVPGLYAPISISASGQTTSNGTVWTGTVLSGVGPDGFELGGASQEAYFGTSGAVGAIWTGSGTNFQTASRALYAMSGVLTVPEPAPAVMTLSSLGVLLALRLFSVNSIRRPRTRGCRDQVSAGTAQGSARI